MFQNSWPKKIIRTIEGIKIRKVSLLLLLKNKKNRGYKEPRIERIREAADAASRIILRADYGQAPPEATSEIPASVVLL